ncbi:polyprenyl synthetase family protein [Enterococcus alcedinis]|uniref:Geranylgeranyl pyrophosphate synthase n=1 Tax=Enterococcus alcedinis TaxID=1274384 RepID=A0A917JH17_9ENTE|nr:polyprenyl synthetase family protein [Enterococcus alcedinis]MBP2103072.1 heptaprenyl diphosphate synthase [Enterococcus alcedinis]GGI66631.1 geranylgeranyl pyrophosphate synthase [Enterococcus alcedinis]
MTLHSMWEPFPTLQNDLTKTLAIMENSLHIKNKDVEQAIIEMIRAGGKLLRPAYQILFAQFGTEKDENKILALAAAIEMLHTATLIHDDIVDDSDLRRNLPTVRARFGNATAVYAGDYLFVACFRIMADYATSMKSLQMNSRSMEKILAGELGQMDKHYYTEVTVDDYLENISGKTAELFALSCAIGAFESGSTKMFSKKASEIGHNIGMAFQILDDILDYSQDRDAIGKPVLEDVRQGIYSLPLLYALEQNPTALKPLLAKKEQMTPDEALAVLHIVEETKGVERAQKLATKYTDDALKAIQKLPNHPDGVKETLLEITKLILHREN